MQTGPLWQGQEENPERFEGARRKAKASERRSFLHTAPLHNNRYGIRSEGSSSTDGEILRCAQDDRQDASQARSAEAASLIFFIPYIGK